jgi:hypothetical protein
MRSSRIKLGLVTGVLGFLMALSGQVSAQLNDNDRQVSDNLQRLQTQMSNFRYDLLETLKRVRLKPYRGEDVSKSLEDLESSIRDFNTDFRAKRESSEGVNNILQEAQDIEVYLRNVDLGYPVSGDWTKVRATLDQLASNYKLTWDWSSGSGAGVGNGGYSDSTPVSQPISQQNGPPRYGLSGSYRLDTSASDNTSDVAERAVLIINARDRGRVKAELEEKLTPPETLTLEIRGQQVSLTSSNGGQNNFTADGTDKYETTPDRKSVRVRALLKNEKLTITKTGDNDDDYTVIFESIDNGAHLRVTRRVNYASMSQTVLAESVYNKTSDLARNGGNDDPGAYSDSNPGNNTGGNTGGNNYPNQNPPNQYPTTTAGRVGDFIVPNGTVIRARLENEITTKASQNNDRFTMTVQSPKEFSGAVIEGFISGVKRSGKLNGRAQLTFNFERIRLKSGEMYEFAGYLQSITDMNGELVKIDTEGVAKGESQTKETAKRGGVGAAIGAVIGGVLGGVKGAVIGATIGGSAGAGSVYVQGRDDLELKPGSTVTLHATAPGNR